MIDSLLFLWFFFYKLNVVDGRYLSLSIAILCSVGNYKLV